MTDKVTKEDIKNTLEGMVSRFDKEYETMTKEDLEARWFFEFDASRSLVSNLYNFHDKLNLYKNACRRWEELHNGGCCVVERVRDEYLLPKIRKFEVDIRAKIESEISQ